MLTNSSRTLRRSAALF
jgi:glutaryl-CoA dehydrogenase